MQLVAWFTALILSVGFFVPAYAGVNTIEIQFTDKLQAPRWQQDKAAKLATPLAKALVSLRKAELDKKSLDCLSAADQVKKKAVNLSPWIAVSEVRCGRYLLEKRPNEWQKVSKILSNTRAKADWFLVGPQSKFLKQEYFNSSIAVLNQEIKLNKQSAWQRISELQEIAAWTDNITRAGFYQAAGLLAFQAQKNDLAKNYYTLSLKESFKPDIKKRLDQIDNMLAAQTGESIPVEPPPVGNQEEINAFAKFSKLSKEKEFEDAVEIGVLFLTKYPGSLNSDRVERDILSIFNSVAGSNKEKDVELKEKILKEMSKAPGERLLSWTTTMISREYFADAFTLSNKKLEDKSEVSMQIKQAAAMSAYYSANLKAARGIFEQIFSENSGAKLATEALYRLGLIDFREAKYADAANRFEAALSSSYGVDFELSSMYWSWRSYQSLQSEKERAAFTRLTQKYPMSYYGIRAQGEQLGGKLSIKPKADIKSKLKIELTDSQFKCWERAKKLLSGGWFQEAQNELLNLPEPSDAEGKIHFAGLWAQAFDYVKSSEILQRAFSLDPTLMAIDTLSIVFPAEFDAIIQNEAQKYKVPKALYFAIMKQESGFHADAKSPVGALGLMQLLPSTASEIGKDIRVRFSDVYQDLLKPEVNIKIGTYYIVRRIKNFDGHVPLALAAYNAGIGNIKNWLKARPDLKELSKNPSSKAQDELWIEELPWAETSYYIKSILRNYLIYKLLAEGSVQLQDPIWPNEYAMDSRPK